MATQLRHNEENKRAPICECGQQMEYLGQEMVSREWQRYAYRCLCGKTESVLRARQG